MNHTVKQLLQKAKYHTTTVVKTLWLASWYTVATYRTRRLSRKLVLVGRNHKLSKEAQKRKLCKIINKLDHISYRSTELYTKYLRPPELSKGKKEYGKGGPI